MTAWKPIKYQREFMEKEIPSERPILFSSEMVRAILDGRKTMTRRVLKKGDGVSTSCPYGEAGDRLWVREAFHPEPSHKGPASYRATWPKDDQPPDEGWKPSIFMPRWASRITLEIVSVRVERVQDITPEDCRAEGMPQKNNDIGVRYAYGQLWNQLNEKRGFGWSVNPYVWVIEFRRLP